MKKLALLFVSLFVVALLFAAEWVYIPITWNTGESSVTGFVVGDIDTSDVFKMAKQGIYQNWLVPETLSFLFWSTENVTGDSVDITFSLQLSNDQVYWHDYGTLLNLMSAGGTGITVVDDIIKTDFALFKWGRIHAISAAASLDTVSFGADVTLDYSNY